MPVMNGWEFLNKFGMVAQDIQNHFSIYILTGVAIDKTQSEIVKQYVGVKNFYTKPLNNKILREIIS